MQIRIVLDEVDPPLGRLFVVKDRSGDDGIGPPPFRFAGWLELLRALYEVTGESGRPQLRE